MLKKIVILVCIYVAVSVAWNSFKNANSRPVEPLHIDNPVFAEIRLAVESEGRSIDAVMLAKTVDAADCQRYSAILTKGVDAAPSGDGPMWKRVSAECKSSLTARNQRLFNNEPTFVSYLSISPRDASEREVRMIYWGVTAEESDRLCNGAASLEEMWRGPVKCVPAIKG